MFEKSCTRATADRCQVARAVEVIEWAALWIINGRPGKACVIEEIGGAQVAAAKIRVPVAVNLICSGLGDDIQNNVSGLPVFRVVVVGQDLESFTSSTEAPSASRVDTTWSEIFPPSTLTTMPRSFTLPGPVRSAEFPE